jgi:hypothetical protein
LQTGDSGPLSGVAEGKGACVQEPWIWLPWQAAVAVGDTSGAPVGSGPPKAVIPRSPSTDAGMVDSGILAVSVSLGNEMLSYIVSRPIVDTGPKL